MKLYTKQEIIPVAIIVACFLVGMYSYPFLPARVPLHWGLNGEPNRWGSKASLFVIPIVVLVLYLVLLGIPYMDPLKKNIVAAARSYFLLRLFLVLFMAFVYALTLIASLGYPVRIGFWVLLGIAALFWGIGTLLPTFKKNYTVGIRLPWTLHSERVWEATHRFGGKAFRTLAVITAFASVLPDAYAFAVFMIALFGMLVVLVVYAHGEFRKEEHGH